MINPYGGREQTEAKHLILRTYLKALAIKLLEGGFSRLSYVDAFSGPWESRTEDFSDTSFKIALTVLSEVAQFFTDRGKPKQIGCFFIEKSKNSFRQLQIEVERYHQPERGLMVRAVNDEFENQINEIRSFTRNSFALIFIDPTGWTGYPLDKLSPLLRQGEGEVLLNFMLDFINRFASSRDQPTVDSFEPILGKDWRTKLDQSPLPKGEAAEELFLANLKAAGRYEYVLSTKIEKTLERRTHFSIVYATRKYAGLKTFRDVEYKALKTHEGHLSAARTNAKAIKTGQQSFFQETGTFDSVQESSRQNASGFVSARIMSAGTLRFDSLAAEAMEKFMVRETDVKDLCVTLAKQRKIEATWKLRGSKFQKPDQNDLLIWIGEDTPPTPPSP